MQAPNLEDVKSKLYAQKAKFFTQTYCAMFNDAMTCVLQSNIPKDETEDEEFVLSIANPDRRVLVSDEVPSEEEGEIGCFTYSKMHHVFSIYNPSTRNMIRVMLLPTDTAAVVSYFTEVSVNRNTGNIRRAEFEQAGYYVQAAAVFSYNNLASLQYFLETGVTPEVSTPPLLH